MSSSSRMISCEVTVLLLYLSCFVAGSRFIPLSERVPGGLLGNNDNPIPIEEYISQHGYPVEDHNITTQDGYILTYHRIPHGKSGPQRNRPGPPVLLQHGLLCASPVWVTSDNSLGFSLADAGFDVWLGNSRGNTYSRKHIKYDPDRDKEAFWDFSWHEMGYYDLPASIDYILNVTGHERLFYIGHSMGTTMYFVLGATRPEYMDKVQAAVTMAPVVFPWNVRGAFGASMNSLTPFLNWLTKLLGLYEIMPRSSKVLWLDRHVCANPRLQVICSDFVFAICGFDKKELNMTVFPTILEYLPDGASFKELEHFSQIRPKGSNFKQFDYGYIGNLWRYGSYFPPTYNLTNVRAPLYIYYGQNDWVADPQDVFYTVSRLPNVKKVIKVANDQFNHIDFMWAIDAKTLIYDDVISTFNKYVW
ncbi:hypothetical protein J6590_050365 [Homalodisca vitripennis]|nr:hypothetical protein J6590_050365 [Homalodisca vitripennis]